MSIEIHNVINLSVQNIQETVTGIGVTILAENAEAGIVLRENLKGYCPRCPLKNEKIEKVDTQTYPMTVRVEDGLMKKIREGEVACTGDINTFGNVVEIIVFFDEKSEGWKDKLAMGTCLQANGGIQVELPQLS